MGLHEKPVKAHACNWPDIQRWHIFVVLAGLEQLGLNLLSMYTRALSLIGRPCIEPVISTTLKLRVAVWIDSLMFK